MSSSITSSQQPSQAGVHPSAIGSATDPRSTGPTVAEQQNGSSTQSQSSDRQLDSGSDTNAPSSNEFDQNGYPEQHHAGAVGYGPQYGQGPGLGQKVVGLKEQLKGKVSHNPALVQQGKERYTGELKRKKDEEDRNNMDPFGTAEEKEEGKSDGKPATSSAKSMPPQPQQSAQRDERGQEIQASTTAPEGMDKADRQRQEGNPDIKHIDESARSQSQVSAQ